MFKLFKNLRKKDYVLLFFVVVLIILQVWLDLKMPDYMSEITRLVKSEGDNISGILKNGGYMLLCAGGSLVAAIITGFLTSIVSANFSKNTRKKIFTKVEELSIHEIKQFSVSSLITRSINDITQIQMFISMGLQLLIKSPITAIWAVTKILNKNLEWSIITAVATGILLVVIGILTTIVIPRFKIVQKLLDKLNSVTRENLNGIRVVRAFNAEDYQEEKFEEANDNLTNLQLFNQKAFSIMQPIMYLVMNGLTFIIYFTAAYMIDDAMMSNKITIFSDMVVFSSYAMQVIASFLMLAFIFMILPRAQVSAKRINEVLDTQSLIKNGTLRKKKEIGTIEFKNVFFKYQDGEEYLLSDINFRINKGETVAIIGSTGTGKTSLINLITRLYDATDGTVLVDGIDVSEYDEKYLHDLIGYVSQKAVIFNDTIVNNVKYSKTKLSNDKVLSAIDVAQGKEFIEKMDDKYDSVLAAGGTNVSGGQKQRISIARAIAKNPEIYIFDDSFSALDYKTDSILRKRLKEYTKDATTIIVAQRIGTIMNADKIIVLDDGKIVGLGKHEELLKNCSVYQEIASSQLTKEELENA